MNKEDQSTNAGVAKTIGLCMIVKNEAHVIRRCLECVKPLVDYVLVEDTGSTDGTQDIIRGWLEGETFAGQVIEERWLDFAYNRTLALERLREVSEIDYVLVIDADDQLWVDSGFDAAAFKAALSADVYDVEMRNGGTHYKRPQLFRNALPFRFRGVLHEYLEAPPGVSRATANGFHIESGRLGARNKNPRKYEDDAATLELALRTEKDPFLISRYTFYLAQSYRDCGEKEKALSNYLKRAEQAYWAEEVFESLYNAGKLQETLRFPPEAVIATYLRASQVAPSRVESLHAASRYCRSIGRNEEGFQLAKRGLTIDKPSGELFVERWIYDYGLLDELAINGYWSGHYKDCLDSCLTLLGGSLTPADQRSRIADNARFAMAKLGSPPELGSFGQSNLVDQHAVVEDRPLRSRVKGLPKVLMAILAKQKAEMLPLYLECIEALDYPKEAIHLYIRTNNNTDKTEAILSAWLARVGSRYAGVEFDPTDVEAPVQQFSPHEWNPVRFRVLGQIRNASLQRARDLGCDFYFTSDVDNYIRPNTLRELVSLGLPIAAPLLRSILPGQYYSNYHAEVDGDGYYKACDQYQWILNRWIRGVIEVPVVHTTYLVRADVIPELSYIDDSTRHEYVVFSESARKAKICQYLDNRQVYGYILFGPDDDQYVENGVVVARSLLAKASPALMDKPSRPRVFGCFGQHGSGSTWMFNLAREICRVGGVPFVSVHQDSKANLPWNAPGKPLIIAKTHNPMKDFRTFIAESGEPFVITVRDPRDAVASFMQRFPNSLAKTFDEALKAIALSADRLLQLLDLRPGPVLRYEDGFVGDAVTVDHVAAMLAVPLTAVQRNHIIEALSPDAVRRTIKSLEEAGKIRGESVWDRDTHWHAGHVGDGRVGKWPEVLSSDQVNQVLARTSDYCARFGYRVSA